MEQKKVKNWTCCHYQQKFIEFESGCCYQQKFTEFSSSDCPHFSFTKMRQEFKHSQIAPLKWRFEWI
jgi:hypothetical protein